MKVYIHEGKIIAVGANLELYEYLNFKGTGEQTEVNKQCQNLEKYGKELFEAVKLEDYHKGEHIFGTWITIEDSVSP